MQVTKSLRFSGTAVPRDYEERFQWALWVFRHQRVYCPDTRSCVHLRPLPPGGIGAADVDVPSAIPRAPAAGGAVQPGEATGTENVVSVPCSQLDSPAPEHGTGVGAEAQLPQDALTFLGPWLPDPVVQGIAAGPSYCRTLLFACIFLHLAHLVSTQVTWIRSHTSPST
jgi:hypothetical protein